jgi:hypothetical protein
MDISLSSEALGLGFLDGGRAERQACLLIPILLTTLRHVNCRRPEIVPRRIQKSALDSALGSFLSNAYALGLTVPHKTVAEPH